MNTIPNIEQPKIVSGQVIEQPVSQAEVLNVETEIVDNPLNVAAIGQTEETKPIESIKTVEVSQTKIPNISVGFPVNEQSTGPSRILLEKLVNTVENL